MSLKDAFNAVSNKTQEVSQNVSQKTESSIAGFASKIVVNSEAEQKRLEDPTYKVVKENADQTANSIGFAIIILMILSPIAGAMWQLFNVNISTAILIVMLGSMLTNMVANVIGGLLNRKVSQRAIRMISQQVYDKVHSDRSHEIEKLQMQMANIESSHAMEIARLQEQLEDKDTKLGINELEKKELEEYRLQKAVSIRLQEIKKQTQNDQSK